MSTFRNFILNLPGFNSYCNCDKLCSAIQIEHVMPRRVLKKSKQFSIADKDPHNLYRCCHVLNREKGSLVLGQGYHGNEFGGMLARSCLYMNYKYDLKFHFKTVTTWNNLSLFYPPFEFEYRRSEIIKEKIGNANIFIDEFPLFGKH